MKQFLYFLPFCLIVDLMCFIIVKGTNIVIIHCIMYVHFEFLCYSEMRSTLSLNQQRKGSFAITYRY